MKHHFRILVLTFLIIITVIIISYFYFENSFNESIDFSLITYILFIIFCCFYPISLYTCWRLIFDEVFNGVFIYKHLMSKTGNIFGGVFFIPFILAPLFIPDYISYFRYDLKMHKNSKSFKV